MKVMMACGGSGGHIFPATALASRLKARVGGVDIFFVGSDRALDKRIFEREKARYALLSSNKLPYKKSFRFVAFLFGSARDMASGFGIVRRERPDVIVGFGGYVSAPIVLAACALRIPVLVHEQNVVPGRANEFLFRFADRVAVSFRETAGRAGGGLPASKITLTGNPIRPDIRVSGKEEALERFGLKRDAFTVLIIGGSKGAARLNRAFMEFLRSLDERERNGLQAIHIAGEADCGWVSSMYDSLRVRGRAFSFLDDIDDAYSACDLALTRSGASALFELAYFAKPMVLIPYPHAMSHQLENAKVFSRAGAAVYIEEKDLSTDLFSRLLLGLKENRARLRELSDGARAMSVPEASDRLADEVIALAGRR